AQALRSSLEPVQRPVAAARAQPPEPLQPVSGSQRGALAASPALASESAVTVRPPAPLAPVSRVTRSAWAGLRWVAPLVLLFAYFIGELAIPTPARLIVTEDLGAAPVPSSVRVEQPEGLAPLA